MKRAFALEPFSRDHNDGLHLARALKEGRVGAPQMARDAWDLELADHFAEEERLLGPLAGEMFAQMQTEHNIIAMLVDKLPESACELGQSLESHIRWEERVLFPAIESALTAEQDKLLTEETLRMEHRRWQHAPKRARLVERRISLRSVPGADAFAPTRQHHPEESSNDTNHHPQPSAPIRDRCG